MHKTSLVIVFSLLSLFAIAQSKEGFWDNVRITSETLTLKANEKKVFKSENLPIGTTEVVIRITVLDENQQLSSSLVSLLKAIPDPTGISQGSAGAVFLVSKIAGDDKCKYGVFSSQTDANNFVDKGVIKSLYIQNTPINKEAKLLKLNPELKLKTSNLWFVFESDNWFLKQKVIVEIVPWVNYKESRGWDRETKNEVIELFSKQDNFKSIVKKDQFIGCFLEAITSKYTYKEFDALLKEEKAQLVATVFENCRSKHLDKKENSDYILAQANQLFNNQQQQKAIDLLKTELLDKNIATASDYSLISTFYLQTKQFDKAEQAIFNGISLDQTELKLQLNLAHLYLFKNELSKAKQIHKTYKNQNISANTTWVTQTKYDYIQFEKRNITSKHFKKILKIIE